MSAERKTTEHQAAEKSRSVEQPRVTSAAAQGASRPWLGFASQEVPPVRLSDGPVGAGQNRGSAAPPAPTLPTRPSAVPPSPTTAASATPAFAVTASVTGTSGPNAVLTPEPAQLLVDSARFTWNARVSSPSDPSVANWDVGFIQNATEHSLEAQYRRTTQRYQVPVPIRDVWQSTAAPWYDDRSHLAARPGAEVPVAMSDTPWHRAPWNDPRTGEVNALVRTTRHFRLKAWLVARHRVRQAMVYLRNVIWGLDFTVNVNGTTATNAGPGMVAPAMNDGQGSSTPVLGGATYNEVLNNPSNRTLTATGATPARAPAVAPARPRAPAPVPVRPPAPATAPSPSASPAVALSPATAPAAPGALTPEVAKLVGNQGGGDPLPSSVLAQLETALDVPLGLVRVHTDAPTRAVVDGIGVRAFTYGLHIYLGSQASVNDVALMAHEITHVIQQQGRPVLQTYSASTGDAFEYEAHRVSGSVQQGRRTSVEKRTSGARMQALWPISQIVDWIEDRAWDLVNRYAPGLVPIIRKGPLQWLKEKIVAAVETIVDTVMAPVRAITGLASSLRGHFANLLAWLRDAAAKIARGDCSSLTEAAHKIHDVFMGIVSPIIDRIKSLATRVKNFFGDLWDRFGAPVWAFLRRIGGAVWDAISSFGRWLWDVTEPIRRILARAWRWIKNKLGIGEGPEGQNGILQWIQGKAQSAWDNYILPFIERFKRPLLVVGGILLMLSPAGPIIAIGAIAYGVIRGVQAIRQYFGTRGGIVNGRNILQNEIIPGIVNTINRVAAFLKEKAQFLADKLNSIVGGLGNAAGAVAGTIIGFIARGLTWLAERFGELVNWVMDHVMSFVNWVGGVLQRLVTFLQPVLDFLRRVAAVIRNIMRIGYEFGARIWNAIPACIRDPFIDFFIPLILRQIPFFSELGATPEAWQQTRASIMLLVRQIFRDWDLWGAMRTAFGIVVRALRIPIDLIRQLIEKASRAWNAVLAAPIRFIRSALQAILRGVGRFIGNFLSHLWYGVQGWLFNAVSERGITPPSSWTDLRAVFGFVLDVLGISLDHVLDLLATRIGRPAVARIRTIINVLTGVWEWVSVAIREGPAGIWRMIVERLRDLGNMVLQTAVQWVMTRIMAIVGARLAALAASAGLSGILEAVYAVYQAIQTAIEYARRIIQVLITVFDTIIQIAQGVIDPAAQGVETGLRMIMPVVIGFLANYAGLGGIGARIREIIDGVRSRVDAAILWLIDRALAAGRWLLDRLRAGVAAVVEWWRARIRFSADDGTEHSLYFEGSEASAQLMVATTPVAVDAFLVDAQNRTNAITDPTERARRQAAINDAQETINELNRLTYRTGGPPPPNVAIEERAVSGLMRRLTQKLAKLLSGLATDDAPVPRMTVIPGFSGAKASQLDVKYIFNGPDNHQPGTPASSYTGNLSGADPILRRMGVRDDWVAFHILNENVGGLAVDSNLIPTPRDTNGEYLREFEAPHLKHHHDTGDVGWMEARFNYRTSEGFPEFVNSYTTTGGKMKYVPANHRWDKDNTANYPTFSRNIPLPSSPTIRINQLPVGTSAADQRIRSLAVRGTPLTVNTLELITRWRRAHGVPFVGRLSDLRRFYELAVQEFDPTRSPGVRANDEAGLSNARFDYSYGG
jgi:phage-related protein